MPLLIPMAFSVREQLTATDVPVVPLVGSVPFVVYFIVAPEVASLIVTVWRLVYVPPPGLNDGVATVGRLMVYVADAIELSDMLPLYPMAFNVRELLIVTDVPIVPWVALGVVPSVVYRMVAPDVAQLMVTVWLLV
jgi:hypothetical protein